MGKGFDDEPVMESAIESAIELARGLANEWAK